MKKASKKKVNLNTTVRFTDFETALLKYLMGVGSRSMMDTIRLAIKNFAKAEQEFSPSDFLKFANTEYLPNIPKDDPIRDRFSMEVKGFVETVVNERSPQSRSKQSIRCSGADFAD